MAHTKNTESASFYFAFGKRSKIIDPLLKNFDTTLDRVIYLAETNIISKEDSRGSFLSIFINLDTPRAPGSKRFIDIIVQTPKKNFFPVFKEDSNALISLESLQRKTSLILIKSHEHASINPDIEFVSTTDPSVFGKIHAWTSLTFEVNSQSIQDDFIKFIANEYMLIFE